MRAIGFSTGAVSRGDFTTALSVLREFPIDAVELSALRSEELPQLLSRADALDLSQFRHVAVHAPSRFVAEEESRIVEGLQACVSRGWFVVAHPDSILDFPSWRALGSSLWIENMDRRKATGRTAEELLRTFDQLPDAGFCLDVAHARQVDATLTESVELIRRLGDRVRQLHVSEVAADSSHAPMSTSALSALQEISEILPADLPVIIESPVSGGALLREALLTVWNLTSEHESALETTPWLQQWELKYFNNEAVYDLMEKHRVLSSAAGVRSAWESLSVLNWEGWCAATEISYRYEWNDRYREVLETVRSLDAARTTQRALDAQRNVEQALDAHQRLQEALRAQQDARRTIDEKVEAARLQQRITELLRLKHGH